MEKETERRSGREERQRVGGRDRETERRPEGSGEETLRGGSGGLVIERERERERKRERERERESPAGGHEAAHGEPTASS
jgi:hypothetical protein